MGELRLDARISTPTGQTELAIPPGGGVVVDGVMAPLVVAALAGHDRGGHRIRLDGRELGRRRPEARVRAGLVVVGSDPVAGDVSVRDHLAAIAGGRDADRLLADAPLLADRGSDPAGVLSGGERRMLGFLRALALEPSAVVADRAGAGLDRDSLAWAAEVFARWQDAGVAVVVHPSRPEERRWLR